LSYESMHKNRDNIVRVSVIFGKGSGAMHLAGSMSALGPAAVHNLPMVKSAVRFKMDNQAKIKVNNKVFTEPNFFFADPSVFKVFTFPLVKGNKSSVLDNPSSIVISQAIAKKYYGDTDPIGKTITYDGKYHFTVIGVMKNVPQNTMLRPQLIAPYAKLTAKSRQSVTWYKFGDTYTYLWLKKGTSLGRLHKDLRQLLLKNTGSHFASMLHFTVLRLANIHFKSKAINELAPVTNIDTIYLFSFIAFLVLIIACLNFINLSTARSIRRSKEVGLRKVMGARRSSLIYQFFGESFFLTMISVGLSLLIFEFLNPLLNSYFNVSLNINPFETGYFYVILIGIIVSVSLLSGIYPALFLSKFKPVDSLRSVKTPGSSNAGLRKALVAIQFGITVFLIVGTAIAYNQLSFMRNSNLGFEKKNVVVVNYPINKTGMKVKYPVMEHAFKSIPGVTHLSGAYTLPGINSKQTESFRLETNSPDNYTTLQAIGVGYNFIPTLGLTLIKGRDFSKSYSTDKNHAVILNEAAVKSLGLTNPVGTKAYLPDGTNKEGKMIWKPVTVIGIVKNFHVASFREQIAPIFLYINPGYFYHIAVRFQPQYAGTIVASLIKKWYNILPAASFNYSFLTQTYNHLYSSDAKSGRLISIFSFLSILIACMGLLGSISYTIEVRVKEIGIRKLLGASVAGIVAMLSKDFLKLVGIGFFIAVPIAWYAMHRWLQNFAYHIHIGIGVFLLAGILAMIIALATVSWQSVRAALMNPVESLRNE
ncbi:MAG TPA: ABC transporter permease, partial [Bacteroidales bacterium]|nr:ABC transporter permease [Bacteroidales bacterium]